VYKEESSERPARKNSVIARKARKFSGFLEMAEAPKAWNTFGAVRKGREVWGFRAVYD